MVDVAGKHLAGVTQHRPHMSAHIPHKGHAGCHTTGWLLMSLASTWQQQVPAQAMHVDTSTT
jgi:hypothetical protein